MREDLAWFGLEWDFETEQSLSRDAHEQALDQLAERGLVYPCSCSRSEIRAHGLPTADGGFAYPGTCRARSLPNANWRESQEVLRVRLDAPLVEMLDESGVLLEVVASGDPVVKRRDGAISYQLATVVDDAAAAVTRIVRGRDLAASTALQVALQRTLGLETPQYRHHLLLLEERGDKLAKFHGAVGAPTLRAHYTAQQLCGWLAWLVDLQPEPEPTTPRALLPGFAWDRVASQDRVVRWTGSELEVVRG